MFTPFVCFYLASTKCFFSQLDRLASTHRNVGAPGHFDPRGDYVAECAVGQCKTVLLHRVDVDAEEVGLDLADLAAGTLADDAIPSLPEAEQNEMLYMEKIRRINCEQNVSSILIVRGSNCCITK